MARQRVTRKCAALFLGSEQSQAKTMCNAQLADADQFAPPLAGVSLLDLSNRQCRFHSLERHYPIPHGGVI